MQGGHACARVTDTKVSLYTTRRCPFIRPDLRRIARAVFILLYLTRIPVINRLLAARASLISTLSVRVCCDNINIGVQDILRLPGQEGPDVFHGDRHALLPGLHRVIGDMRRQQHIIKLR